MSARWDFRVSPETDRLVRQAAATTERTLTAFVVDAAVVEAERLLADRTQFVLEPEQRNRFVELLDRSPQDATVRALKGQPRARAVSAILLARLAVDREHQGAGLGRSLLQDVLLRCDAAKAWYMRFGFEESSTDPLHLLMLLKDVRALVERHGAE